MSRPSWQLRDAALGYASRGIPVLPLHYPLPHHGDLQTLTDDQQPSSPAVRTRCSCRDRGCGQPGKHPVGTLVPHGVKGATTNRARILAWWTRHPQANIGLATGHRFDVLDVDGPVGAQAIRELAAEHGLVSSGPLVRTGGVAGTTISLPPASATSARAASSVWTGAPVVAMSSLRPAATPPASATGGLPAAISTPHPAQSPGCCSSGCSRGSSSGRRVRTSSRPPPTARVNATRGQR